MRAGRLVLPSARGVGSAANILGDKLTSNPTATIAMKGFCFFVSCFSSRRFEWIIASGIALASVATDRAARRGVGCAETDTGLVSE
jgi:hypothetical protein